MRILLVDDEDSIRIGVKMNLELQGFEVVEAEDAIKALKLLDAQYFDLIILDVMMPHMDGFQLCEMIRLENDKIPILFLTAKESTQDRITGLRRGADDYLVKPFALEELILRVQNLLKRNQLLGDSGISDTYSFGGNWINFSKYRAKGKSGEIRLSKKESMLLKLLTDREGEVVSRNQILQTVWGYDIFPSTRTIDNFILSFRKYFEPDPKSPIYFHSIRGVGYQFTNPHNSKR